MTKIDLSSKLRLLIVEDDPTDLSWLEMMLSNAGVCEYTARYVDTARDAIAAMAGQAFDCVLLDLSLPDSVGIETLQLVLDAEKNIPVVVFTQSDDLVLGLEAIDAGAQEYLVKGKASGSQILRAALFSAARAQADTRQQSNGGTGAAIDAIRAPWVILDESAMILSANAGFQHLVGAGDVDLAGVAFNEFVQGDHLATFMDGYERVRTGNPLTFVRPLELVSRDGSSPTVVSTTTLLRDDATRGVLVVVTPGARKAT